MSKNKKLLLVGTVPWIFITTLTGQPKYLNKFYDVSIASSDDGSLLGCGRAEGVETYAIPMVRGVNPLYDLYSIFCMIRLLLVLRPDIVHSYTPKAGLISMISAFVCRTPVRIHTFTGLIFPTQKNIKKYLLIWVDRIVCRCATIVIPEGRGVLNDLKSYAVTKKSLDIIGNGNIAGVDTSYFCTTITSVNEVAADLRKKFNITGFVFCFVGRLHRDKGIYELVRAFSRLNGCAHLLIVGEKDSEAPIDNETLGIIQMSINIHCVGFLSDVRPALAASDVLVLPSYREGFPNVLLQANAMTLPVIATNVNGSNEIVEPNVNGWLVPSKDIRALHAAMDIAMNLDNDELKVMGISGRKKIQDHFERKEHWERMMNFYNRCFN